VTSQFSYNIYIPSLARNVSFRELDNRTYLNILKFIQNNDDINLTTYLNDIIKSLCNEQNIIQKLNRLDKYCILLTIIMVCIGNNLEFNIVCQETEQEYKTEIVVSEIISKLADLKLSTVKVALDRKNYMTVSIPKTLYGTDSNSIEKFRLNGKTFDTTKLSEKQLNDVIEDMPYNIFNNLHDLLHNIYEECEKIDYFTFKSPYIPDAPPVTYTFNLYDNSFYEFIKLLFKEDLLSFYKMYYALTTKFKFDMTYVQSITPAETKMYLSFIHEDMESKKKQMDSVKTASKNITSPVVPATPGVDMSNLDLL